jgi:Carboxypeptidase regulatory-like domain
MRLPGLTSGAVSKASNLAARLRVSATRQIIMRLPIFPVAVLASALASAGVLSAQAPESAPSAESSSKQAPGKTRHGDDFLIRGTVFTPEGLALPGALLRIRRKSEKKFQWNDASNARGDFAIRVKMGADYEVLVRAKGYRDESQAVDAKTGERFKDLVFRMQRQTGKKS